MLSNLVSGKRPTTLIDWLFDPAMADHTEVQVANALTAAAGQHPKLARAMRDWTRAFVTDIARVVAEAHPNAEADDTQAVATGIAGLFMTVEAMAPLGPMTDLREASKAAALKLAGTLEG